MNHLAHALLAGPDPQLRLGGLMGDFVRGAIDPALHPGIRDGIALHRAIDSYTDSHAHIVRARALFDPPYRRYAGILIDIWFDHLLARDYDRWSDTPLEAFSDDLLALLRNHDAELPQGLRQFSRYLHARRLPAAYARRDMISEVLIGVGSRLKRANPLAEGLLEISRLEPELQDTFDAFFPQLADFAKQWLDGRLPTAPE
ncbi:MAG TPA: ACP phosphodiesterase [Dokdonella sp.]|nr:ACP phosphodiesterase [Dokdonella sp.]